MANEDILIQRSPRFLKHRCGSGHVENEKRLSSILELFEENSVLASLPTHKPKELSLSHAQLFHTREMLESVIHKKGETGWFDPDTYYGPDSVQTALLAAGSLVEMAENIWKEEYRRGFALLRPPGHHAVANHPMGFCLLNNVVLAAKAVQQHAPEAKIAIVDFDLHHGNGTQDAFIADRNVLFLSSHRFPYYPGTGSLSEVGIEKAEGTTINFPVGTPMGANFFTNLYASLVFPMLSAFGPDFILVSAGYDGHLLDPMQGFKMTNSWYRWVSENLIEVAEQSSKGRILFCLEGGYNPAALKDSVKETLMAMVDVPRGQHDRKADTVGGEANLDDYFIAFKKYFPEI